MCSIKNIKAIKEEKNPTTKGNNRLTMIHCSISKTTNNAVAANSIPSVLKDKISEDKAPMVQPKTQ